MLAPVSLAARGFARNSLLFASPKMRGWRAEEAHALDYSRAARFMFGRVRIAGPWRSCEERPRLSAHHRGILRNWRSTAAGPARGPVVPPSRLPGGRPGTWLRATHAGAASRPTSYDASAEAPLSRRD